MKVSRRSFLHGVSAGLGALGLSGARSPSQTLRVAIIGCGVRGKYLISNLPESVRVTALCDCATLRMASTLEPEGEFAAVLQRFKERDAARCTTYQDYRRLLDQERLDAVLIATPDHHHVLAAMLALQAGLDVYLEKPLSICIREGRRLVELVERTGRVLQVGSQQRSMEINRFACEWIRAGGLGRISKVELANYPGPLPMPSLPQEPAYGGIDFDLFCGPAPLRPHHRRLWMKDDFSIDGLLWRGWDLFRDYSGHMMTNWGAHSVDMVQYALGRDDTGPVNVEVLPPTPGTTLLNAWKDKTPDPAGDGSDRRFWPVKMRYIDGMELHFVLGRESIVFHGEKGILKMRRNFFETDPPDLVKDRPDPSVTEKWKGAGNVARPHIQNWLDCILTRRTPVAPVTAGHRTATICHLANIARELGRSLEWDPQRELCIDDPHANSLLDRPRRKGFELPSV